MVPFITGVLATLAILYWRIRAAMKQKQRNRQPPALALSPWTPALATTPSKFTRRIVTAVILSAAILAAYLLGRGSVIRSGDLEKSGATK